MIMEAVEIEVAPFGSKKAKANVCELPLPEDGVTETGPITGEALTVQVPFCCQPES